MPTFSWSTYTVEGGSITPGLSLRSITAGRWEPRLPASPPPHGTAVSLESAGGGVYALHVDCEDRDGSGAQFISGVGWSRVIML